MQREGYSGARWTCPGLLLLPISFLMLTRTNALRFFVNMSEALLVNFGTASSIATYLVTLKCLVKKNGLDQKMASLILSMAVLINLASYPIIGLLYVPGWSKSRWALSRLGWPCWSSPSLSTAPLVFPKTPS